MHFPVLADVSQNPTLNCSAFFATSSVETCLILSRSLLFPTNNIQVFSSPDSFKSPTHLFTFSNDSFLEISYTTKAPLAPL